jgi:hypothetical protein
VTGQNCAHPPKDDRAAPGRSDDRPGYHRPAVEDEAGKLLMAGRSGLPGRIGNRSEHRENFGARGDEVVAFPCHMNYFAVRDSAHILQIRLA